MHDMTDPPSLAQTSWLREMRLQAVLTLLGWRGGEARVAGGAVRNALLKVPVADVDIATNLPPDEVMDRCRAAGFGVHPTGIEHGTVTVVNQHMPFEVTTLRSDVATDGRRATVIFTDDWQADAARRDFTMNAMYCDANGKVYDYTNGYADILKRRVRFVGDPEKRIREDYLRILRFFRFHAHYGAGAVDADGLAACTSLRLGIEDLSAERIRQELLKLLVAPRAGETLKVMAEAKILHHVLDFVPEWEVVDRLPEDAILRLAALARSTEGLQDGLRLSNEQTKRLMALREAPEVTPELTTSERRRLLYDLGERTFIDAVNMSRARAEGKQDDLAWKVLAVTSKYWSIPQFPLTGRDLQGVGLEPGPAMGETLRALEDWWIASDFNPTRDQLLARAQMRK
jgi:poly(A) polymerase